MVWLPVPCAEETPDPELLDDEELPAAEVPPDDPLEPPPAEDELPLAAVVPVVCVEPGRAKAIKPAPARPAAPTAVVTARRRACPRRLAAANRAFGSAEFIGFLFRGSHHSPSRVSGSPVKRLCASSELRFVKDERSGNMRPGGVTGLVLVTSVNCQAGQSNATPVYHSVVVTIPGGGQVVINGPFDLICGLQTSKFAVRQPQQRYTQSPVSGARVALDLPSGMVAGTTLDYVAALTNPTGTAMVLSPCPGYQQGLGLAGKAVLSLNCRAQRTIPAHQTVRFAMRLHVPADTPTGPGNLFWLIAAPADVFAHGSLHVYGRDTPCRASQLHASVTGPGKFPGPPNVMGIKKAATEVPLTVTNISGRACSVYGVPAVAVRGADGSDLGLRQIPNSNFSMRPVPQPQAAITLTPHIGTARATLYWYGPWCGPNPNPVTVTITFPANGAKIAVIPTGGWVPAPCRGASAGPHVNPRKVNPGWVSADAFQPGQPPP